MTLLNQDDCPTPSVWVVHPRRPAAVEHARILKDLTPTLALEAQRILLCGAQCAASVRARPGLKYYAGDKDQEQKDLRYSPLFYDESVVRAPACRRNDLWY